MNSLIIFIIFLFANLGVAADSDFDDLVKGYFFKDPRLNGWYAETDSAGPKNLN
jgi:hypothetical protein